MDVLSTHVLKFFAKIHASESYCLSIKIFNIKKIYLDIGKMNYERKQVLRVLSATVGDSM